MIKPKSLPLLSAGLPLSLMCCATAFAGPTAASKCSATEISGHAVAFSCCAAGHAGDYTTDKPVMVVAGKQISLAEFKYSYFKNADIEGAVESKTPEEYAEMFLNYKLKVAAAEAAGLDTLQSFRTEFTQYRDMQLMPMLVDSVYIDSVAAAVYNQTAERLAGQDMLRLQHILIPVAQGAPADEVARAQHTADSLAAAIHAGANFEDLARRFSKDPGSATKGGELPWIGPGMTLKEFETAAYALSSSGCVTAEPVRTSVGFHIIRLMERKALEPYSELRADIVKSLKRQGIDEASAEARLKQLQATGLSREAVMDSLLTLRVAQEPDMKFLVQEYHDGLLLYEMSKREVWEPAAADTVALERLYKSNKKKYAWTQPHFKGYTLTAKSPAALKKAQGVLKKAGATADCKQLIKTQVNADSVVVRLSGPYLVARGENATVDHYVWNAAAAPQVNAKFPNAGVSGRVLKQPQSWRDVRATLVADYQQELENAWVERLRATIPYSIDETAVKAVAK